MEAIDIDADEESDGREENSLYYNQSEHAGKPLDYSDPFIRCNTSTASGFVKKYFESSRLHHISASKAELSLLTAKYMARHNKVSTHPQSLLPFKTIMHVDMDCFFCSVALRKRPDLVSTPVAIAHSTHSNDTTGSSTSQIASCNYPARDMGVRSGSFLGAARKVCPDLIVLPYSFDEIDACSKQLYNAILSFADYVEAVSCDEAYVDVSWLVQRRANTESICEIARIRRSLAEELRQIIFDATSGCVASIGISTNPTLARMATKRAKPNGVFLLDPKDAMEFLKTVKISDLPGVGSNMQSIFEQMGVSTCNDVQHWNLSQFQSKLGLKKGLALFDTLRGIDDRILENKPRQSIGADINWGVRFQEEKQVYSFLRDLCDEIAGRLHKLGAKGKQITLNVKKKLYEGEPGKFLGKLISYIGFSPTYLPSSKITSRMWALPRYFKIMLIVKTNHHD